jgi:cell division protein FtsW
MAYKPSSDRILFTTASLLAIFGLVMVFSASSMLASDQHEGMSAYFFLRQLVYAVVGFSLMVLLMNLDYHFWQGKKQIAGLLLSCTVLLILVLFQPAVNGAHRWLRYKSLSFQPSEMAKLALLVFLAAYLHKYESEINRFTKRLLPCGMMVAFFAALIYIEPDLGQALCILLLAAMLLFLAGLSWKYIGTAVALAVPAFYLLVVRVPERLARIQAFRNPELDPLGDGWQIMQSLTALGSGGLFGLGPGASRQKLYYLPEPHSDFIFAVIGEEWGLIGTSLICLAFLVFFFRGIKVAMKAPDRFGFYLGLGITLMVVAQGFINISMVLNLMPTKGIALPFISQGGSSLLMNLTATGVLLNISNYAERS